MVSLRGPISLLLRQLVVLTTLSDLVAEAMKARQAGSLGIEGVSPSSESKIPSTWTTERRCAMGVLAQWRMRRRSGCIWDWP